MPPPCLLCLHPVLALPPAVFLPPSCFCIAFLSPTLLPLFFQLRSIGAAYRIVGGRSCFVRRSKQERGEAMKGQGLGMFQICVGTHYGRVYRCLFRSKYRGPASPTVSLDNNGAQGFAGCSSSRSEGEGHAAHGRPSMRGLAQEDLGRGKRGRGNMVAAALLGARRRSLRTDRWEASPRKLGRMVI